MDRLSRFGHKFRSFFGRKSRQYKKEIKQDLKEMTYDVKHLNKKTLTFVYSTVVVVTSLGTTCTYLAYNTYFKYKYMDLVLLKVGERTVPLNEHLELLALREWNTAHVQRYYKLMGVLNYFPCKGSDIISIGDLQSRTGVDIGLPHNFSYNSIDDVKLSEVTVFGKSADESVPINRSKAMKDLIDSLVLSENAKKFAITREIHFAENYRVVTEALNIMISTMAAVGVGQQIILSMNIRGRYLLSFVFRCFSLVLGLGVWFLLRQTYTYGWNVTADEEAVAQGLEYYEGALEYYQKLMQRNAALYQLLGSEGRKRYTKDGEFKGLFSSVPSLKKRLEKIRDLNEINSESKDTQTKP